MIRKAIGYCVVVLFCLPLAGCFKSKVPLIDESNADKPFKTAAVELKAEGGPSTFHLELRGSGYEITNASENLKPDTPFKTLIFFHKVQDGVLIVQVQEADKPKSVDLYIARIAGNDFTMDNCEAYTGETRSKAGIQRGEYGMCEATGLDQLVSLAKAPPDGEKEKAASGKIQILEK